MEPEDLGLDPVRLDAPRRVIQTGLDRGLYPGAAYVIGRGGRILAPECFGTHDPDGGAKVSPETIYDIASLTKPIATAASLLVLVERGQLHLRQPVADFFPDLASEGLAQVTVTHLLTHTSGLPAYKDLYLEAKGSAAIIESILKAPLESGAGEKYVYSCLGYILLGAIIERVSGVTLDRFAEEHLFRALGMSDTGFNPASGLASRIAATSNSPAREGTLVGAVHDPIAWGMGGVSGNAGLFSTVLDMARFSSMILAGGAGVLSPAAICLLFRNLLDPGIGGQTAGWFVYPNEMLPAGDLMSRESIGHTGFTGTSVVIDPHYDVFVTLLTNRVCSPHDRDQFSRFRRLFHNAVAQSVQ